MRWDALVVGGGPAGATAAAVLAEAGRRVVVFERTDGPHHKVCGEFLSGEAFGVLERLGIGPAALDARPIGRVRLTCGSGEAVADLPFAGYGVGRDRLDEAVLTAAAARGTTVRRGAAVRTLEVADGGRATVLVGAVATEAEAAVLATGKHELRGHRRAHRSVRAPIGFKQHWRLAAGPARALDGTVEVHLFPGGYAGLQPAAGGRANLCLVVESERFERLGRSWSRLLDALRRASPRLAERLAGAEAVWPKPLAVAGIPYGFLADRGPEDVHRVGDQLAVIPSFCGDGMAIALHSGAAAAGRILAGHPPEGAADYAPAVRLAGVAGRLLEVPVFRDLAVITAAAFPGALVRLAAATRVAARNAWVPAGMVL